MKLRLVYNWREVLRQAFSVWLMALSVLLICASVALSLLNAEVLGLGAVPFAVLAGLTSALAIPARLILQAKLEDFLIEEDGAVPVPRSSRAKAGLAAAVLAMAVPLVGEFEGLRLEPYRDVVGVLTWCYGETEGAPQAQYTKAQCDVLLEDRLAQFHVELLAAFPALAEAPVGVQVAALSLAYNMGLTRIIRSDNTAAALRAGEWRRFCTLLPSWRWAGGKIWQGLVNRRAREQGICLGALA